MSKKSAGFKQKKIIVVNREKIEVWPSNQHVKRCMESEPDIQYTKFDGPEKLNQSLAKTILKLENDLRYVVKLVRGGCGTKIDDIHRWKVPEAELVHARAIALFLKAFGFDQAVVDQCWANIYRKGDYCMPHSHIRSRVAIVYVVDPGDDDPDSPLDGRFYIADPRIKSSCDIQEHCLTQYIMPSMASGSMICFPGPMVHGVNPYNGERPRITLSWNINRQAIPGKAPEL
jgi:hypothetical protein